MRPGCTVEEVDPDCSDSGTEVAGPEGAGPEAGTGAFGPAVAGTEVAGTELAGHCHHSSAQGLHSGIETCCCCSCCCKVGCSSSTE